MNFKFEFGDKVKTKDGSSGMVVSRDSHPTTYWVEIKSTEDGRKIDCFFLEAELELEDSCEAKKSSPSS